MADRDSIRGQALQLATETGAPVAIYTLPEGGSGFGNYYEIAGKYPIVQVISP